jgi:hypothetical protein
MAVYYFEGAQILAPVNFISNEPIYDSDTVSLKKQRATQNAQRWELSFNTLRTTDSTDAIIANLTSGITSTATMIMPQLRNVAENTTASGTPHVDSTTTKGTSAIPIDRSTSSGIIPKGAFIKFSNHDKVYITTQEFSLAAGTVANLAIFPSLRQDVPAGTNLETGDDCVMTYYRDLNGVRGIQYTDGILSNEGLIVLIEAI